MRNVWGERQDSHQRGAHAGQEYVWQKVWTAFGLTERDVAEHFSGPSFLAWNRMGNLRGYAGPLPQSYIDDQAGADLMLLSGLCCMGTAMSGQTLCSYRQANASGTRCFYMGRKPLVDSGVPILHVLQMC